MESPAECSKKKSKALSVILGFFKGTGILVVYELFEELLEELIVRGITAIVAEALSFMVVVLLTQITKVSAKGIAKAIFILLKPAIKKLVYKEGNDKTQKILRIIRRIFKMDEKEIVEAVTTKVDFKALFSKLISFLKRNKKTNTATIVNVITSAVSGAAAVAGFLYGKVDIPQWSIYLIGCIVVVIVFALQELGIVGKGMESQVEYDERKAKESAQKQAAKDEAEKHAKEIAEAKALKEALAKEQKEAEAIKAEAEARQKEIEKARAEEVEKQERINKINQIKINYQIAVQNGFEGDINAYIDSQIK